MLDEELDIPLAMLMVNLTFDENGRRVLLLNGIQAPGQPKDRIVRGHARPQRPSSQTRGLKAAYAFANWIGADQIVATTKANHVSQAKEKWQ